MSSTSPAAPASGAPGRDVATSLDADPERYDRARPGYPPKLAHAVLDDLPGRLVVDVGIGTGISARVFRDAGAFIVGVEADERIADLARRQGFQVELGRFETWDAAGRTFDAVIAGQTWHWVDPSRGTAKAAAVLRPRGRLALFWNAGDPPPDLAAKFDEIYRRVDLPFTPWQAPAADSYRELIDRTIRAIRANGLFTEPEQWMFSWQASLTTEVWLDMVRTFAGYEQMAADQRTALLQGLGEVVDAAGGSFTMHYSTLTVSARRTMVGMIA